MSWVKRLLVVLALFFFAFSGLALAGIPVFPGAEGYGSETVAGRGGTLFRVTKLTDSNPARPGEFRYAVEAQGPRVIVFETSGMITLSRELPIFHPFITIAGQTAPSPGVTIRGHRLRVATHDVLLQHLRLRPGDQMPADRDFSDRDGVTVGDSNGAAIFNVVIDHCSFSWAPDEIVGIAKAGSGGIRDITVSNSILAESLTAKTGSYGVTYGEGVANISLIRNLLFSNRDRNPLFRGGSSGLFLNNIVYNGGAPHTARVSFDGPLSAGAIRASVIGNVFREGPSGGGLSALASFSSTVSAGTQFFAADNTLYDVYGRVLTLPLYNGKPTFNPLVSESPVLLSGVTIFSSGQIERRVLRGGARPADRDPVDNRILTSYRNRTGAILRSQKDVGGWPAIAVKVRPFATPALPNGDDDGDGYTNLEEVLHALAAEVEAENSASCSDGTLNGDETGLDCGGSCAPCPPRGITDPFVGFRMLEPTEFRRYTNVIRIPGGTKTEPVLLDQGYTEYVLDGDIEALGTALAVKVSNVTVNLNGFTVTYQTSGAGQEFGIRADGALKNVQIVNGTIRQSEAASTLDPTLKGSSAIGSPQVENGIQPNSISDGLFAGLNIIYRSASTCGISMMWASGNEVKFCTFIDEGDYLLKPGTTTSYWDRSGNFAAVRFPRNSAIIHHNRVVNARQCGVTVGNGSRVYQNDIVLRSRHTNSAGVMGHAVRDVRVYGNRITGTGAHLFGAMFGGGSSDISVYGNYFGLTNSPTLTNMWETAYHGANGFRTTGGLSNASVNGNTMVIGVYDVPAYPRSTEGQGLFLGLKATDLNVRVFDNDVDVRSHDEISRATAVAIHAHEGGRLDIHDNYLKSNHSLVAVSTDYGTCNGYPLVRDNRFEKVEALPSFKTILMDEWGSSSFQRTARFISNVFAAGTSFFDVKPPTLYKGLLNDISREHYLDLLLTDYVGNPLPYRSVVIRDNSDHVAFSGVTDAGGNIRAALPELWLTSRISDSPMDYFTPGVVGSLNLIVSNPYTVIVDGIARPVMMLEDEVMTFHLP